MSTDLRPYRIFAAVVAIMYSIHYEMTPAQWHFIDNVDLLIHEAGHTLSAFFGTFIYIAAGSGFQILIPILFFGYFVKTRQYFSSTIMLLWLGINLLNVARYAGDAIVMQLQLLGGDSSGHDWHNLLVMTGTLQYTQQIAGSIWLLGVIVISFASAFCLYLAFSTETAAHDARV